MKRGKTKRYSINYELIKEKTTPTSQNSKGEINKVSELIQKETGK